MTTETKPSTEDPEVVVPVTDEVVQPEGGDAGLGEGASAEAAAPAAEVIEAPVAQATGAPAAADTQLQARLAALEKLNRDYEAKTAQEATAAAIAQLQQELIDEDGVSPARAKVIAERQIMAERNAEVQVREADAKALYAAQLAAQHKRPEMVASLMRYNTVEAMTAAAQRMADEGKQAAEIASLKAELAKLKKGQVPPQSFDRGNGGGESGLDYDRILREGKPLPPSSEIDKLTAKYLRG